MTELLQDTVQAINPIVSNTIPTTPSTSFSDNMLVIRSVSVVGTFVTIIIGFWRYSNDERIKRTERFAENSNHLFDADLKSVELRNKYNKFYAKDKMTQAAAQYIYQNRKGKCESIYNSLIDILDIFEKFSLVANMGLIDNKTIYRLCGHFLIQNFNRLQEFIKTIREEPKYMTVYCEFESLTQNLTKYIMDVKRRKDTSIRRIKVKTKASVKEQK